MKSSFDSVEGSTDELAEAPSLFELGPVEVDGVPLQPDPLADEAPLK